MLTNGTIIRASLVILFPVSLLGTGTAAAQDPAPVDAAVVDTVMDVSYLELRTLPSPARIVLRWAPADAGAWLITRRHGYWVERAPWSLGDDPGPLTYRRLTSEPLRVWPLERYTREMVEENHFLGVVGQAVHGEYFDAGVSTGTLQGILREAKETQSRFQFSLLAADLDSTAADALAVRYVDDSVVPGETYVYRLYAAGADSVVRVDTAYAVETAYDPGPIQKPTGLAAQPGDSTVTLSWDRPGNELKFSGYWIDRSTDGGRTYERVDDAPFLGNPTSDSPFITYRDTALVNYRLYKYRVRGITYFGVLSDPATVDVVPIDLEAPPPPFITETEHIEGSTVRIKWEMMSGQLPDDLDGFYLGHSIEHDGDYVLDLRNRLGRGVREALDSRAIPTRSNYYVVVAVDTADNVAASLPSVVALNDSVPPTPPVNLRVVSVDDSTGRVEIGWDPPAEPDFYAYRVYRKHNIRDEWVLRNVDLHFASTFADTLNLRSLTNEVYYQLVALDFSFNPSAPSEALRVPLPDFVPPVAPVFTDAVPTDSSIWLEWSPSPSFDVVDQILYRRLSTDSLWNELVHLGPKVESYTDYDVQRLHGYEYTLQVTDSTGFFSNLALPVKGRVYDTGLRPGISNLKAVADTSSGSVRLSWTYPEQEPGEYWFVVYRGIGDAEPARYRAAGTQTFFDDRRVGFRDESNYVYAVQVFYRNGGLSPLSERVVVRYERAPSQDE